MRIKVGEKIPAIYFFHIDNSGVVKKVKSTSNFIQLKLGWIKKSDRDKDIEREKDRLMEKNRVRYTYIEKEREGKRKLEG